ncbi:MAG: toxin-antitoxin system HicB family antitoxin, partial [Thermodesulfobacteriota bacterium]|nr:toxin-antitoxin system HicB family antitoxin [Thermodesulfobacteriota bacterium]
MMSLRLPKSMYGDLKDVAKVEGVSMNQFVTIAIAEKIALLNALDYLGKRAKRGNREKLLSVLAKSPDVEPEEYD